MLMNRTQQGMTVIGTIAAMAIAAMLLLGLSAMIDFSMEDVRGQQTALHQEQVANAASKYISTNYRDLVASTAGGTVATVTIAQLKAGGFLPDNVSSTNLFNQTPCILVRQPAAGKLEALVATYGGAAIPERYLPMVAMEAGHGSGYISTAAPGTARGASWEMDTAVYQNASCDGTLALTGDKDNDGGHLVSNLFYGGPGQFDFLYRNAVPGRPQLNQMKTTVHMMLAADAQQNAQATEGDTADPRCTNNDTGKIAVDASGQLLSCQSGVWKRQGFTSWKEPAETYGLLPLTGNDAGDVRMVKDTKRAFTWDDASSSWVALAIDQNDNLVVPNTLTANFAQLNRTVVKNDPCPTNGMIARDATGLSLSCQSGYWRNPLEFRLTTLVYDKEWVVRAGDTVPLDSWLDLSSVPGARPLYLTGYAICHASGFPRAYAYVNVNGPASGNIAGGCMSRPDSTGIGVLNKGVIGLQIIQDNAARLHIHTEVESGAAPGDYIDLVVKIYSSE